jgi:hypothetical protein
MQRMDFKLECGSGMDYTLLYIALCSVWVEVMAWIKIC